MENEKGEFWTWIVFLVAMIFGTFLFYQACQKDRAIWNTSKEIRVRVIDKRWGNKSKDNKIGIRHGRIPIYVYAGKKLFRQAKIDSLVTIRYSATHHSYIDPYHKFNVDKTFLGFLIIMSLVILWRTIWFGLYIWYWKKPGV